MKTDLNSIDRNLFWVKEGVFCGIQAYLVFPKKAIRIPGVENHQVRFTQRTSIYRSSIWDAEGNLLCGGWKKFVNYGENEENFPVPTSLKNTSIVLKEDGTATYFTKKNGILNIRTRGSFDLGSHVENISELNIFKEKYQKAFDNELFRNEDHTFLYEWTSPDNQIVIKYDEPELTLLGIVKHKDYSYYTQSEVDQIAEEFGLRRPKKFHFNNINEVISSVKEWRGKEGVCLYHHNDQQIHKIKARHYLFLHHIISDINTEEKLVDIYLENDISSFNEFYAFLEETFDYECANGKIGDMSRICDAHKEALRIIDHMKVFSDKIRHLTRKEQAEKVISSYGNTNRAGIVFTILDNKPVNKENLKKLIIQSLN